MSDPKGLSNPQGGKRGGGKLNRTETVTIRLDPKLNYLCDLAARAQRRTKSSFIESAIADRIDMQLVHPRNPDGPTFGDLADDLWHVRDSERLIRLADNASHLMSYEEQQLWALICETGAFWFGRWQDQADGTEEFQWTPHDLQSLRRDQVGIHWNALVKVADGTVPVSALPQWARTRKKTVDPDDIPF